jgi:hypothetical protein
MVTGGVWGIHHEARQTLGMSFQGAAPIKLDPNSISLVDPDLVPVVQ